MEIRTEPLTPVSFLARSADVFGDRTAVIDGDRSWTYAELEDRSLRLAGSLASLGVEPGDRVAVLAPNTHALLEAHYGVPYAGGVLNALNHRLSTGELAYIVGHAGARVLIADVRLADVAAAVAASLDGPITIIEADGPGHQYETMLDSASPLRVPVTDELSLLSLNYTSGTTGRPKGVMYHHRGAYLQALAMAYHSRLDVGSVFMWTLPMFHCNGWCFTWAVTAAGSTHLCLPELDPSEMWRMIRQEGVTHFNAAPTVLTMLANHPGAGEGPTSQPVRVGTGGAPPSPTLLEQMAGLNIDITHLYGLTETFGPITLCEWRPEWSELTVERQALLKARQGVGNVISQRMRVVDADGADVAADGETMGEVALQGNNVMAGYYRDPEATATAIPDGWFRTGDLGVMHSDGYVELRDRAKDIIISGGENIASIEIEQVIQSHQSVLEVAVVAAPDPKWGEVPVAFVTLRDGAEASERELTNYVRDRIAHFKAPKRVVFGPLPKTSTGKVQKYELRERVLVD